MIYTVTFNPSLDYYLKVNNLKSGSVNRTASERLTVGGKGVNISLELKKLGDESVALGFIAGFTGQEILHEIEKTGITHDFIEVDGRSRINVKIKSTAETDINGAGALITAADVEKLTARLKEKLKEGDFVLICGNAPAYLGNDVYADIISELKKINGVNFVVDACGKLLTNTLRYKPFLIKPNYYELCEIFGLPATTTFDTKVVAEHARKLQKQGARNVIVSLGSSGAVMVTETQQALYVRAAKGQLVNSVGAGDCMIAGFVHEYLRTGNYFKSLNFATAAGSACAFTADIPTKEQIDYVESLML
ncbi:MAG: 1-phosphofructokinase [Clostridia bacterium]|nr:1-phosphofructokinase [Clostridia bacterium]